VRALARDAVLGLGAHAGRAALAGVAVAAGTAALAAMGAVTGGLRAEARRLAGEFGADVFAVRLSAGVEGGGLRRADVGLLRASLPGALVAGVTRRAPGGVEPPEAPIVAAADAEWFAARALSPRAGRVLDARDAADRSAHAVLTAAEARRLGAAVGDVLDLVGRAHVVVGIVPDAAAAGPGPAAGLYVPADPDPDGRVDTLWVKAAAGPASALETARRLLAQEHPGLAFAWHTPDDLLRGVRRWQRVVSVAASSLALLFYFSGGAALAALVGAGVRERTREIGLRRALGARPADIAALFVAEAVLLSGAAALAGAAVGLVLAPSFAALVSARAQAGASAVAGPVLAAAALGALAAWRPARRAARLPPADALRFE
jgi:putative ABC transport system permease protein